MNIYVGVTDNGWRFTIPDRFHDTIQSGTQFGQIGAAFVASSERVKSFIEQAVALFARQQTDDGPPRDTVVEGPEAGGRI